MYSRTFMCKLMESSNYVMFLINNYYRHAFRYVDDNIALCWLNPVEPLAGEKHN